MGSWNKSKPTANPSEGFWTADDTNTSAIWKKAASSAATNIAAVDTSNPLYRIPVFLSYARPYTDMQTLFQNRVIAEIRNMLLFPRTLGRSDQYTETTMTSLRRMLLSSYGLIGIAFQRVYVTEAVSRPGTPDAQTFNDFWLTSPYLQIETSMAYQYGLPVMMMVEDGVNTGSAFGGVLEPGAGPWNILRFNLSSTQSIEDFFQSVFWKETFVDWVGEVRSGYKIQTRPPFKFDGSC